MSKILHTTLLQLRCIEIEDLENIHTLHSLAEVDAFNTLGIPKDIEETKSVIQPWIAANQEVSIQKFTFAIELKQTLEFIGLFGLTLGSAKYNRGEIWYKLMPASWGKGYATSCVKRVLQFGFDDLKLHRIEAGCAVENIGSWKVLEKAGMKREGHCRKILPLSSGWADNYEYAILESDPRLF